ncbi:hypothetical protein ACGYK1_08295 [Sulfitobacter sp. 1A13191]|jgi:hypothetical protein|uniref:hypothetical protein n=1 Tax=unclassified Sulfitobacter TaxID=196795 RepID=UPI0037470E3D
MFDNMRRELQIRRILRKLSRQRVALTAQSGSVWVIEKALEINNDTEAHLKTCYMRGWVEPIDHAIPTGKLTPKGELPQGDLFTGTSSLYRLTDSGWAVINRSHLFTLLTVFLAVLTLIATVE